MLQDGTDKQNIFYFHHFSNPDHRGLYCTT